MQLLPDLSNTEVVRRLRAGDDEVFTQLYNTCYRMVYLQAMKILNHKDDAEDVAQDVFIAVFHSIDKLQEPEALRSWSGGIAVHKALKARQKRNSSHEFAVEESTVFDYINAQGNEKSPEEITCNREVGATLAKMIDQLPDEQRITAMLFWYDHCGIKEIAQIMDCAEGTVKSRINYAKKKLRQQAVQQGMLDSVHLNAINPAMLFTAFLLQERSLNLDPEVVQQGLEHVRSVLGLAAAGTAAGSGAAAAGGGSAAAAGGSAAAAAGSSAAGSAAAGGISAKVAALVVAGAVAVGGGGYALTHLPPEPDAPAIAVVETVTSSPPPRWPRRHPRPVPRRSQPQHPHPCPRPPRRPHPRRRPRPAPHQPRLLPRQPLRPGRHLPPLPRLRRPQHPHRPPAPRLSPLLQSPILPTATGRISGMVSIWSSSSLEIPLPPQECGFWTAGCIIMWYCVPRAARATCPLYPGSPSPSLWRWIRTSSVRSRRTGPAPPMPTPS